MSVTMRSHSLLTLFTVEAPITVHVRVYVSNLEKYNTMQFLFPVFEDRNQENYDVIFGIAVPYNDIIMNFWRRMLAWMYYR
jgi:hypothetical protein